MYPSSQKFPNDLFRICEFVNDFVTWAIDVFEVAIFYHAARVALVFQSDSFTQARPIIVWRTIFTLAICAATGWSNILLHFEAVNIRHWNTLTFTEIVC